MNRSDNRRIMDDLPQIKIFEKCCALLKTRISLSKAGSFVNGRRVTLTRTGHWCRTLNKLPRGVHYGGRSGTGGHRGTAAHGKSKTKNLQRRKPWSTVAHSLRSLSAVSPRPRQRLPRAPRPKMCSTRVSDRSSHSTALTSTTPRSSSGTRCQHRPISNMPRRIRRSSISMSSQAMAARARRATGMSRTHSG